MDQKGRLKLLFSDDESLLEIDTRLNAVSIPDPQLEDKAPLTVVSQTELQPQDGDPELESSAQLGHTVTDTVEEDGTSSEATVTPERKESDGIQDPEKPTAPLDGQFCPLIATSRYPYKFIKGELSQQVASGFFDEGKFWKRGWDMYYIHVPLQISHRPLLLVPATQVREFLKKINQKLELESELSIPEDSEMGMLLDFNKDGIPQPTFIGQCTSREVKDQLEASIPLSDYQPPSEVDEALQAYEQMIENAVRASKNKSKSKQSKAKRQQIRIQVERELSVTRKRIPCYLGLQPYRALDQPELIDDKFWEEKPEEQTLVQGIPQQLDMNQPVQHPFWKEPIFISIDVECNERCHEQITEVGISTLDTLDLCGLPPGENAANWTSRIRSRHMRVLEYRHIVNSEFVSGCPGNFEFGESEWASTEELADVVHACFWPPYSFSDGETDVVQLSEVPEYKRRLRNLVLVGHNTSMDVKYLQSLGVRVFEDVAAAFVESVDTAELYRIIRGELSQRSLGGMLGELGIMGWHLHNAGNDARYTLEAMVRMICRDVSHEGIDPAV